MTTTTIDAAAAAAAAAAAVLVTTTAVILRNAIPQVGRGGAGTFYLPVVRVKEVTAPEKVERGFFFFIPRDTDTAEPGRKSEGGETERERETEGGKERYRGQASQTALNKVYSSLQVCLLLINPLHKHTYMIDLSTSSLLRSRAPWIHC